MSRSSRVYLDDILQAIRDIREFTSEMTREQFMSDRKTQHACIRNLEVIGEAVKHLPPDLRDRAPEIEWQKIAGLRDILTHEYFGVDRAILWDIITNKLSDLRSASERLLAYVDTKGNTSTP
jgi:uncharacterized protein with HEPN domain